ncbi:MAG: flagellar basal body P-ring formation chaperone FlgA [Hyphomicrobiaceae bacterium]|nr:flagellar basal body P-ring formation chaperone FlgA [Hyphomicrobiaceae bacterium]
MSKLGTVAPVMRGAMATIAVALSAVAVHAEVQNLPVPKIVIYPGETISEDVLIDRAFSETWSSRMPVHKARGELVGKVARRTLVPGQPVPVNALRVPDAVTQGKTYRIEYREAGLVISGMAVATTSGAVGDIVSLRNPDSGIVVRGIVSADGTIRMGAR